MTPATAVAAAVAGLMRWTMPPLPMRQLKLRLVVVAHTSPSASTPLLIPRQAPQVGLLTQQPADVVRFSPANPRPESFVSLSRVWERTELTPNDLCAAQDFRWQSVDGLEIQGWLYRARGDLRGTIVKVHGGPTWHIQDWIDAIKNRTRPVSDVETGHRTSALCNIVNIAYQLERPLKYKPAHEKFIDDDDANSMLTRPFRGDWDFHDF